MTDHAWQRLVARAKADHPFPEGYSDRTASGSVRWRGEAAAVLAANAVIEAARGLYEAAGNQCMVQDCTCIDDHEAAIEQMRAALAALDGPDLPERSPERDVEDTTPWPHAARGGPGKPCRGRVGATMTLLQRALLRDDEREALDRAGRATPGTWGPSWDGRPFGEGYEYWACGPCHYAGPDETPPSSVDRDAAFIAGARADVPLLAERLAEARQELAILLPERALSPEQSQQLEALAGVVQAARALYEGELFAGQATTESWLALGNALAALDDAQEPPA